MPGVGVGVMVGENWGSDLSNLLLLYDADDYLLEDGDGFLLEVQG